MKYFKAKMIAAAAMVAIATTTVPLHAGYASEHKSYAVEAIRAGDWASAENHLRAILENEPRDSLTLVNLAYVLRQTGRHEEAATVYRQVLKSPSNPMAAVRSADNDVKARRVKAIAHQALKDMPE